MHRNGIGRVASLSFCGAVSSTSSRVLHIIIRSLHLICSHKQTAGAHQSTSAKPLAPVGALGIRKKDN